MNTISVGDNMNENDQFHDVIQAGVAHVDLPQGCDGL